MKRSRATSSASSSSSSSASSSSSSSGSSSRGSVATPHPGSPSAAEEMSSDSIDDDDGLAPCPPPDPTLINAYETLMSAILPVIIPHPSSEPTSKDLTPALQAGTVVSTHARDDESDAGDEDGGRPMTKAEKQNAKKKRRKERAKAEAAAVAAATARAAGTASDVKKGIEKEQEIVVPFRLFSSTPVANLSLSSKEDYPVTIDPRTVPYSQSTADRIRSISLAAAVDTNTWGYTSLLSSPHASTSRSNKQIRSSLQGLPTISISADSMSRSSSAPKSDLSHAPVFVVYNNEMAEPPEALSKVVAVPVFSGIPIKRNVGPPRSQPVEEQVETDLSARARRRLKHRQIRRFIRSRIRQRTAPDHTIHTLTNRSEQARQRKERRQKSPRPQVEARFYASPVEVGGKAAGYAMGYRDSAPGRREGGHEGYVRSKGR